MKCRPTQLVAARQLKTGAKSSPPGIGSLKDCVNEIIGLETWNQADSAESLASMQLP